MLANEIPYDDFGGRGSVLHFAHANAYPPGVYRSLIRALAKDYRVLAVHHRPLWPGSEPEEIDDWRPIAEDLLRFLDQMHLEHVIGVGHSLGAVTTMMAALERPEIFRALVLIEPVFLPPTVLDLLVANATFDEPAEMPIAGRARRRHNRWPSQEAAFGHFRSKRVFDRWSDTSLWDFVRHGTTADAEGGIRLSYSPEWEARIYSSVPTDVWDQIPRLTHPTLAMRGAESDTLTDESWELWQKKQPQAKFEVFVHAGHLLPLERPDEVAARIAGFVSEM